MAVAHARFSGVWLTADAAQVYTKALAEKQPEMYKKDAKYRAEMLRVATEIAKPMAAAPIGTEMCQPLSLYRSLENATPNETAAPTR